MNHRIVFARLAVLATLLAGCADDSDVPTGPGPGGGPNGPGGSAPTNGGGGNGAEGAGGTGATGAAGGDGGGGMGGGFEGLCPTQIEFETASVVSNVRMAGEWQGFDLASAPTLQGPTAGGVYSATVDLPVGLQAYKIVYDDANGTQWVLNPSEGRRKYVDGTENSAILVRDCSRPALSVTASEVSASGNYTASLAYIPPVDGAAASPRDYVAELRHDDETADLAREMTVATDGSVEIDLSGLEDGKYTIIVTPAASGSPAGQPLRLVFWVEEETFSWEDALIYMVVTDRFKDGDPSNDPGPTNGADPRGDWKGGDLEGLRQAIANGDLDQLGVRAIWLTPFQTNPTGAFPASDGVHQVTGYHGYWPIAARAVDPRLGGAEALKALVAEAHAHGIRILQDYVVNHVHQDHEYVSQHPDWFRTGCVCGTENCDWTTHALDCMFASYMPDINHSVPEANAQFVEDAVWWLDEFDLDGLRVDAVKHVEEVATRNLAAAVRDNFEAAGTPYFLMGETAMGWSDCSDPCNDENYGTISKYVGPKGLDGQFDFVLYHGVSYRTFAYGDKGMLHADYWLKHGLEKWPEGAIMTPYIGSHDTPRFTTLADYRGQDGAHDRGIPGNQWSNTASAPGDVEPYKRNRVAMAWLLGLPGAPLLYYGDEYGQWGGSDPNNRLEWRPSGALTADETATLSFVRKMGQARQNHPALRRGQYVTLFANEDTLVFGRKIAQGNAAVVALTRSGSNANVSFDVAGTLGWGAGTQVQDDLGSANVTVAANGTLTLQIPANGAMVLAP